MATEFTQKLLYDLQIQDHLEDTLSRSLKSQQLFDYTSAGGKISTVNAGRASQSFGYAVENNIQKPQDWDEQEVNRKDDGIRSPERTETKVATVEMPRQLIRVKTRGSKVGKLSESGAKKTEL